MIDRSCCIWEPLYRCLYSYTQNQPLSIIPTPTILKILFWYSANTCNIHSTSLSLIISLSFLPICNQEILWFALSDYPYLHHHSIVPPSSLPALLDIPLHTSYILYHLHVTLQCRPNSTLVEYQWYWSDCIHRSLYFIWHPAFIPLYITISFWFYFIAHLYSHSWYDLYHFSKLPYDSSLYISQLQLFTPALHYTPNLCISHIFIHTLHILYNYSPFLYLPYFILDVLFHLALVYKLISEHLYIVFAPPSLRSLYNHN